MTTIAPRPTPPPPAPPTAPAPATAAAAGDALRRRELAEFLRSRRERIPPQQVGIAYAGRRRTPGLRREEVAQLSGVGVTWYTWLEQGRDIHVSEQVLTAVARTLMLDRDERAHLFTLAGASDQSAVTECHAVTPQLQATLDKLDPFPACVQSAKYDVLAYNRAYNRLIVNFDEIPAEDRNCMWLAFTDPRWKKQVVDWPNSTARMVANLRVAMADHVGDATWKSFVSRLCAASPEFAEMWARHEVRAIENKAKKFKHPLVGMMTFEVNNTWLAPRAGRRMLVYVPSDAETERRISRLAEMN
ncbi:MAG TPA: helix-turn-helix transcriptional regulator [Jatrophihabitans sp.]|nr:helix-turn-helix transcriptional regulator [Jatrophihabitans sp.]